MVVTDAPTVQPISYELRVSFYDAGDIYARYRLRANDEGKVCMAQWLVMREEATCIADPWVIGDMARNVLARKLEALTGRPVKEGRIIGARFRSEQSEIDEERRLQELARAETRIRREMQAKVAQEQEAPATRHLYGL